MGTIRAEYQGFIASLARQAVPDDMRRVAHIVGRHLAALVPLGATRRARSVRLAPLLMRELDAEPIELPELGEAAVDGPTFHRLHQLTVGPFRGFMSQETFDLSRAITLVYGANGTGKSSLCEAMEWALLGNISEADSKRIDQRSYCHNARLRRHLPPALIAHDAQGQPVEVQASEEVFRFCFIEKNRIEGFARIAARTPGDQRQLIATLFGVDLHQLPERPEGTWLDPWLNDARAAWFALLDRASGIERDDAQSQRAAGERPDLLTERDTLEELAREIAALATVRSEGLRRFNEARALIDAFEDENRELIAEAAAEVAEVTFHQRIKAAYDPFLVQLKAFMAQLPGQLLQGLGRRVRDFYNGFNRDDPPGDLLSELWLPIAENEKIELEFFGEPGIRYDALQILSEGHIRCLGLAILLAKNMEQECPVVIFDDAVNAIDDDHRNGIWRTLFEDGALDGKQVILTSHGEEFLFRIQQELGAKRVRDEVRVVRFLPHLGEHELRVDTVPPTKNYVLLAQVAMEQDEKRGALREARPALESLTDRLWTWLGNRGEGRIELKLSGPRQPIELNNKCLKLRSVLKDRNDPGPLVDMRAALDSLLGVSGASIEWGYLNSGTHDSQRDGEFDRAAVRTIVGAVVQLDGALADLQGRR